MTDSTTIYREIGRRRIAAGEARTALIRRRYDAPIEDVWEACTDPTRLSRWFLPVSGDLRVGGTFHLAGNASGEIVRCEPPRLLGLTWAYEDRPVDEVEVRLVPGEEGDTILEIEHASASGVTLNDPERGLWGVGVGWEMPLTLGLPAYLRGELPDVPAAEWFVVTPEVEALAERFGREWQDLAAAAERDRAD